MKHLLKCVILALVIFPVQAQESPAFNLKMKAAAQTSANAANAGTAPFRAEAAPRVPGTLRPSASAQLEPLPGSCSPTGATLCYDYRTGSSVFKPSRALMPEIRGMQRESLTLKRNKLAFNYSFK
jgi:hypothetical protein